MTKERRSSSQTRMSLDQRFTELRRTEVGLRQRGRRGLLAMRNDRGASAKNRLLAMQMADRPAVVAALRRSRPRGRGGDMMRQGQRSRSPFPRRRLSASRVTPFFRGRSTTPNRGRSSSVGRLSRSQSLQSLVSVGRLNMDGFRGRGRGFRGRIFTRATQRINPRGGIVRPMRSSSLSRLNTLSVGVRPFMRGRGGISRRGRGGRGRSSSQGRLDGRLGVANSVRQAFSNTQRSNNTFANRRQGMRGGGMRRRGSRMSRGGRGGFTGRGGRGGRGRGARGGAGGRGRGTARAKTPTKETLDMELDEYMSASKTFLDKELEKYMNQPNPATVQS